MRKYSIKHILDLNPNEITKMDIQTKREIAKQAAEYSRNRIKNLNVFAEKHPNYPKPPALRNSKHDNRKADVSWGNYNFRQNVNSMDDNELRSYIAKARQFLNTKTSTVKGWQKSVIDFKKRLQWRVGKKLSQDSVDLFWRLYNTLTNESFSAYNVVQGNSDSIQEYIRDVVEEGSLNNLDSVAQNVILSLDARGAYEEGMEITEYLRWQEYAYNKYKRDNPEYTGTFSDWRLAAYEQDPTHTEWNNPIEFYQGGEADIEAK